MDLMYKYRQLSPAGKIITLAVVGASTSPLWLGHANSAILSIRGMLPRALQLGGNGSNMGAIQMNPRHMGAIHKGAIHTNPRHMGAIAYRQYPGVVNV